MEPAARFGAGFVVARAGNRYRSRSSTGPGNGPSALSLFNPFARVAPSLTPANARDRMGPPSRVPVARTQLHVDDFFGHDAPRMGAGGQLVGLPLIFMGLDHIAQDSSPITHFTNAHWTRPACRDGGNMRHCAAPHTQIGEA